MNGYRATLQAGLDHGRPAARRQAIAVAEQCATWAGKGNGDGGWFGGFVDGRGRGRRRRRASRRSSRARPVRPPRPTAASRPGSATSTPRWPPRPTPRATSATRPGRASSSARTSISTRPTPGAGASSPDSRPRRPTECAKILPGASFLEVRELLITDPARSVEGVDAYRDWLQSVTDEAIEGLDGREFDIHPSIRRCDVRIPPEGSAAAAYYTPPSEDLKRPGQTWFPTVGRTRFPMWDEVSTAYHEAVPGHHLQGATIKLVPLTRAQKLGFVSAHGEGWALYAERLMDELGWFRTPDTRLGFLCAHAFRAARVVADIGLHTGRAIPAAGAALFPGWAGEAGKPWTYDGAIDFMVRAGGMERDKSESEVLRYLSWPSQATAYKLGERTWLAGRGSRPGGRRGRGPRVRPQGLARPGARPRAAGPQAPRHRAGRDLAEEAEVATEMTDRTALLERFRSGVADLEDALAGATREDLDRAQPAGEWTARQVIHHLADSESMAYIRLRRLVAEDEPVIHGYDEPEWARRLHYDRPVEASLAVVAAVRAASLQLLESLTEAEWARTGTHSESGPYSVERWLVIYAGHTHEHADQVRRARGAG